MIYPFIKRKNLPAFDPRGTIQNNNNKVRSATIDRGTYVDYISSDTRIIHAPIKCTIERASDVCSCSRGSLFHQCLFEFT